jgi:hypothetical protein
MDLRMPRARNDAIASPTWLFAITAAVQNANTVRIA